MLSINKKSYVIYYILILQILGALKKLLNQLNFANWTKLYKGYVQGSQDKVMCKSHINYQKQSEFTNRYSYNNADSSSQM